MTFAAGSIQWRCGVCNAASPVGTGGICTRCKKFACNRHLDTVLAADQSRERVCCNCLTPQDRVERGIRGILGKWFSRG